MATHLFVKKANAVKFAEEMRRDRGLIAVLAKHVGRDNKRYKYCVYVYRNK